MYWFDTSGPGPDAPIEGRWSGNTVTFERSAFAGGRVRYIYTLEDGGDAFTFRIERMLEGETSWSVLVEGRYLRQPA
jgi:hypothetical protein